MATAPTPTLATLSSQITALTTRMAALEAAFAKMTPAPAPIPPPTKPSIPMARFNSAKNSQLIGVII